MQVPCWSPSDFPPHILIPAAWNLNLKKLRLEIVPTDIQPMYKPRADGSKMSPRLVWHQFMCIVDTVGPNVKEEPKAILHKTFLMETDLE